MTTTLLNSVKRLSMFFSRPKNFTWIFFGVLISGFFLILFPSNIFEFPGKALSKLYTVFDYILLVVPIFTIAQLNDEKWASLSTNKWKKKSLLELKTENFFSSFIFSILFCVLLILPYLFLNFSLKTDNNGLIEYLISRLSFLILLCFFGAYFKLGEDGRYHKILFIIFSLLLWKIPSISLEFFSLDLYFFSFVNTAFSHGFNFSLLGGDSNLYSSLLSIFCMFMIIFFIHRFSHQLIHRTKIKVFSLFVVVFSLASFVGYFSYQKSVINTLPPLGTVSGKRLDIFFSRKSIISNYSTLVNDYKNFIRLKVILDFLKTSKIINDFNTYDKQNISDIDDVNGQKITKLKNNEDEVYFYIKSSAEKKSMSFLGLSPNEFSLIVNEQLKSLLRSEKKKIGITNLDSSWTNNKGQKSILLKNIERLYVVDVISSLEIDFNDFDLIIVRDSPEKKEDFYQKLNNYFKAGGKIIWMSDSFSLHHNNKLSFFKETSHSNNFLSMLGLNLDRDLFILPKINSSFKNISLLMDRKSSIVSACDNESCDKYFNGFFVNQFKSNYFLLPSFFDIVPNENNSYENLIRLSADYFKVHTSSKSFLEVEEVDQTDEYLNDLEYFPVAVKVKNNVYGGEAIVVADNDIFFTSAQDDLHLNLTGKQVLFSSILAMFGGGGSYHHLTAINTLSPTYLKLLGDSRANIEKRISLKENWRNIQIEKVFTENNNSKDQTVKLEEIEHKSAEIISQLNLITNTLLSKFRSIRFMLTMVFALITSLIFLGLGGLIFSYSRKKQRAFSIK